ncbi:fructose-1,6-bisphosphatase [Proteiniclasticum sp. QWL-01]|uniref:fructose-1,6-bisphosphatase n=1 Tax=Proteiniclasticum sp. QWL-01 TaxID=3036945 RepID=UPI00240F80F6|nr:fructose-1,6-bisphosphatase [Proteiniclasticum sp. QWL-01]WFF72971.1 fructose-1,6-bisphosphatase [Proteiniclasticum sp. QWL-01]
MSEQMNLYEITKTRDLDYLKLLSRQFPNIATASTEVINLSAILNLPKGTEHFISDIHGEWESFNHVMRNASGVIRTKIDDIFGNTLMAHEKKTLATLIYYPDEKLEEIEKDGPMSKDWYRITLFRLLQVCKLVSTKYTRSKVRKALPKDFAYILEELIHENENRLNKAEYYNGIIDSIIDLDRAKAFIVAISELIQRLSVDRLHIMGDIYDRGPGADLVMDSMMDYHTLDITWGNHDILWMGAAAGSESCVANVVRIQARYDNLDVLEDSYGINLMPLAQLAMDVYDGQNLAKFMPRGDSIAEKSPKEIDLIAKMHKAISIIQFKVEGQLILANPDFHMEERLLLDKIDFAQGTVRLAGGEYPLNDTDFPTVDPSDPYRLTEEEEWAMKKITQSFVNSNRLDEHVRFLFSKGSMFLTFNGNLLFHGCMPLNEDGTFMALNIEGTSYRGQAAFEKFEQMARMAYFSRKEEDRELGRNIMWYLWCGEKSPLFGKKRMTTFERYFVDDKTTHVEEKNPYFDLREQEDVLRHIFEDFGLKYETAHIINGHVPVKVKKGESPVKANGKVFVIDGGFAKAYQKETGIAGYTLIYNSQGMHLAMHEPFESTQIAISEEKDILSTITIVEKTRLRQLIADTDIGAELKGQINDLCQLLDAYRSGRIKEAITK